jgi:5-hydroxyisourate hydrolase
MISTHVLDTARGRPAAGITVTLERFVTAWDRVGMGVTDADGRCRELYEGARFPGTYRIRFDVAKYFADSATEAFYPTVEITFTVLDETQHFHVPVLLSPWGFATYRGS